MQREGGQAARRSVEIAHAAKKSVPGGLIARYRDPGRERGDQDPRRYRSRGGAFSGRRIVKQGICCSPWPAARPGPATRKGRQSAAQPRALEGAERDVRCYTELIAKGATTRSIDNATTQTNVLAGQVAADDLRLRTRKVQIGYCTIRAPISGRASMAAVVVGNFVRSADATPLATIIQAPVYVSSRSQRSLPTCAARGGARPSGRDPATTARRGASLHDREHGGCHHRHGHGAPQCRTPMICSGQVHCDRALTFRAEEAVTVPAAAGKPGRIVRIRGEGWTATVRPVTVSRSVDGESVVSTGLKGDETVVTAGHLLLSDGARVSVREAKAGP